MEAYRFVSDTATILNYICAAQPAGFFRKVDCHLRVKNELFMKLNGK